VRVLSLQFLQTLSLGVVALAAVNPLPQTLSPLLDSPMASKCIYCGSSNRGGGCPHSSNGKHESNADGKECVFCGSTNYGGGCAYSPTGKHRHGHGKGCVHCGSSNHGSGCAYNPGGKHVH
jgi:hypothetical protein